MGPSPVQKNFYLRKEQTYEKDSGSLCCAFGCPHGIRMRRRQNNGFYRLYSFLEDDCNNKHNSSDDGTYNGSYVRHNSNIRYNSSHNSSHNSYKRYNSSHNSYKRYNSYIRHNSYKRYNSYKRNDSYNGYNSYNC